MMMMRTQALLFFLLGLLFLASAASYSSVSVLAEETEKKDEVKAEGEEAKTEEVKEEKTEPEVVKEKFEFQAETSRLMDILINSLYGNKDIFLRELISNSNDALDKIRFLSLQDDKALEGGSELEIRISFDKEAKTVTIQDTGIAMSKEELIKNLGTVAMSGTNQFVEAVSSGDVNLIGQFGVGFYSAFLVADKVLVHSKSNKDPVQHIWESTADSSFTVYEDPEGNTISRGTRIVLHLKEDSEFYSDQDQLEKLVKRYSEFITFPIYIRKAKSEIVEEKDDEAVDEDGKSKTKTKTVQTWYWERVNRQTAIWARSPSDVTDQEYKDFYKATTRDTEDPFTWAHFKAEGEVEFKSIIYIPMKPPSDSEVAFGKSTAMKLYVRKVLIADKFEDLMPRYLNFIKGVVDSDDLPLQVSREMIQQSKIIEVIRKKLVRKVLEVIRELANEPAIGTDGKEIEGKTRYDQFWEIYGRHIKQGIVEDHMHRSKLLKLLRLQTTYSVSKDSNGFTTLDEYASRMPEFQRSLLYLGGPDIETVKNSPFLDRPKAKGIEVILLTEPIDEYVFQNAPDYNGHKIISITKENSKLGDETEVDKKRLKIYKEKFEPLTNFMAKALGSKVEKVTVSQRPWENPALVVTAQFGYTANQERLAKTRSFGDISQMSYMHARKTLELNPRHPIIVKLLELVQAGDAKSESTVTDMTHVIFDAASVASGFDIEEVKGFNSRMNTLIKAGMNLGSLDLLPLADPAEEEPSKSTQEDLDLNDEL